MNDDTIVQEVRDIRASIAAEFGYDRTKFIAWARDQTRQRKTVGIAVPNVHGLLRATAATQTVVEQIRPIQGQWAVRDDA
jgi:hypothetical protein